MKNVNKKGFTLVELLVTVSIVGILASMSLSLFDTYRRQANNTLAVSQLLSVVTAYNAYLADNVEPYAPASGSTVLINFSFNSTSASTHPVPLNELFPGFQHQKNVNLLLSFDNSGINIWAGHCKGAPSSLSGYESLVEVYFSSGSGVISTDPFILNIPLDSSECA